MTGLINLKSVVKGKSWCVGMGTWWGTSTVHQVTRFLGEDDAHWTDTVGSANDNSICGDGGIMTRAIDLSPKADKRDCNL